MSGIALPSRPRGVRKHWKREVAADPAHFETVMVQHFASASWGPPVEVVRFSYRGELKRLEALYANGRTASLRCRKRGWHVLLSRIGVDPARYIEEQLRGD